MIRRSCKNNTRTFNEALRGVDFNKQRVFITPTGSTDCFGNHRSFDIFIVDNKDPFISRLRREAHEITRDHPLIGQNFNFMINEDSMLGR